MGCEPTAFCLGSKHSTPELHPLIVLRFYITIEVPTNRACEKSYERLPYTSRDEPTRLVVASFLLEDALCEQGVPTRASRQLNYPANAGMPPDQGKHHGEGLTA